MVECKGNENSEFSEEEKKLTMWFTRIRSILWYRFLRQYSNEKIQFIPHQSGRLHRRYWIRRFITPVSATRRYFVRSKIGTTIVWYNISLLYSIYAYTTWTMPCRKSSSYAKTNRSLYLPAPFGHRSLSAFHFPRRFIRRRRISI